MDIENIRPEDIERRSMEIIESEMCDPTRFTPEELKIVKRVIHTTADFDYEKNVKFSEGAVSKALELLRNGATIVTDTHMAEAGISKVALKNLGAELHCFMSDEDVALEAKARGITRAAVSVEKAYKTLDIANTIYAVGNAPTALIRLTEMFRETGRFPALVIGAPVGFVNILVSKEMIMNSGVTYIVCDGRKGGSTVTAAIINALLYQLYERKN